MFLYEYIWNLATLALLSAAGGFGIIPFSQDMKFSFFLSPLMGLLFIVLGTAAFYTILGQSLALCGMIAVTSCLGLTALTLFSKPKTLIFSLELPLLAFALILIAVLTYATNYSSIFLGQPAFLFMDGSDHLGYAHLADWLNTHLSYQRPETNISKPYQSWPSFMFTEDHPRFGSLFTLGLFAALRGQSGMFAYDDACAIILSAGILGVAAVFSRSKTTFILLSTALLTSHWIYLSRAGYFGKIIAYPALLALAGLFMITARPFSIMRIIILVALASATTAMHHYLSSGLFLVILGGPYLGYRFMASLKEKKPHPLQAIGDDFGVLSLLILTCVATSGIISRAFYSIGTQINGDWPTLLLNVFDLQLIWIATDGVSSSQLMMMLFLSIGIAASFYLIAKRNKEYVATSLLLGSALLLISLIIGNAKWQASQLIGTFYPWFLCAAARCIDNTNLDKPSMRFSSTSLALIALFSLVTLFHEPFFMTVWNRFSSEKNIFQTKRFLEPEFNQLATLVGKNKVTIDLPDVMYTLPVLVELGRHDLNLQWTTVAWNSILNYRHWPAPKIEKASYWLTLNTTALKEGCKIEYKTIQFNLLLCKQPS